MTWQIESSFMTRTMLCMALSLACSSAYAASFDCSKARSKSERLICGDPQLSAMDDQLAALAKAGKRRSDKPRQYQRALDDAWLVRQQCQEVACVELWYRQRLAVLSHGGEALAAPADTAPATAATAPSVLANAAPPVPTRPAPVPARVAAPVVAPAPPVAVAAPPVPNTKPALVSAPAVARQPLPQRSGGVAPAPGPTVAKSAKELRNVTPGAPLQVIGGELGFDIPLTKDAFLDRYAASGGECGASRNLASLKAQTTSAVSDCWTGTECPAPAEVLQCKIVRTAYDRDGRLVLYSATFKTAADKPAGARELRKIVRKFSALAGSEPKLRHAGDEEALSASGSQGVVNLSADVTGADGKPHVGVFSVAMK